MGNELFPACAGVILYPINLFTFMISFPRVCGGDPLLDSTFSINHHFSPRVRG